MKTPRLRSLSIKGFRSFGPVEQTLSLPTDISVVWSPNSKGKTSLAEAVEFLLTGHISRRQILASAQDEFADALRNAHLSPGQEVYVAARIILADGKDHEVKRILTADYAKREYCQSLLQIDGVPAAETDIPALGIVLSQPPLEAPVLTQHTLSYIFSVRPQDRATYFKTLLEVTDLESLRTDVASLADELKPQDDRLLRKFATCLTVKALNVVLSGVETAIPNLATLAATISAAAKALITDAGEQAPEAPPERLAAIERILAQRRSKTFPVGYFQRNNLQSWNPPPQDVWTRLTTYLDERDKVDQQTRQLIAVFDQALKLPAIAGITAPVDCPLCGTETALTPDRVRLIRQHVESVNDFKKAESASKSAFAQLSASVASLETAAADAIPQYLKMLPGQRRQSGFTLARLRHLLADRAGILVDPWLAQVRPLTRASLDLLHAAQRAHVVLEKQMETMPDPVKLSATFAELNTLHATLNAAIRAYQALEQLLRTALNEVLDAQSDTAGWQDFVDIAQHQDALRTALIERSARAVLRSLLDDALKQIDHAKEQVLDDKFSDYSATIQAWWERLRPDEPTFFSAVKPRKGARRTIDFKAGLSHYPDRSAAKVRDVIAIFSQSQLHCLGLALFLARAQHEATGFIILDDPVLSSDEDYRVHFNSTVLTELLKVPMQVVVLTQDHNTWAELETRYRHVAISTAQLYIDTPLQGTIIENTSDTLLAKINRAACLARGGHPDSRKECGIQLRDAGERFCKDILIKACHDKGDTTAVLGDYDGKMLEWLCPRVDPLLDRDPSHPGKLEVFRRTVNRACHDNTPPGPDEMKQACGEIRRFVKDYLGR